MTEVAEPGPMSRSVESALDTAPVLPRDAGAVELARRYATLIDAAAPAAKYDRPLTVLRRAVVASEDPEVRKAWLAIRTALSEHSVASDLGPKLLAVLTSLGMTAAGRSAKGGSPDGPQVDDQLAALRARAQQRRSR